MPDGSFCHIVEYLSVKKAGHTRMALSPSAFLTRSFSVGAERPILPEIDTIADQQLSCCRVLSKTMRTARSPASREFSLEVLLMMLHRAQELEPPAHPARFTTDVSVQITCT